MPANGPRDRRPTRFRSAAGARAGAAPGARAGATSASRAGAATRATPWLARHHGLVLALLFLGAFAWRLAYLGRLAATPFADSLRADERLYWDWASHLLEHGFRSDGPFFYGPLYPYVLALVRAVVGSEPARVLWVQAAWGAAAVVLLADAARRVSRPWVALAVGVLMALYETSVFFDGLVLMESLLFLLEALLIALWVRAADDRARTAWYLAIGAVTGLIAEGRATGALLLVPALVLAARGVTTARRAIAIRAAGTVAAFAIVIAPAIAWNVSTTGEFIPFTYNLGYNLYIGNGPAATGGYVRIGAVHHVGAVSTAAEMDGRDFLQQTRGLRLTPAQSSRYWTRASLEQVRRHPATALALIVQKLRMLWNRRETPQIENIDLHRRYAGPLGLPIAGTFAVLGILGLAGALLAGTRGALGLALRLDLVMITLGTLPFFVTDRYRHHLVPALAVLSAVALESIVARAQARPPGGLRPVTIALAVAAALVLAPLPGHEPGLIEWQNTFDLGTRWLDHQRPDLAVREFERGIDLERRAGLDRDPDRALAEERAVLHFNYGVALHRVGRDDEAIAWWRSAVRDAPDDPRYRRTLGDALRARGAGAAADSMLGPLEALAGGRSEALLSAGWAAARAGRVAEAEASFRAAIAADPRQSGAWTSLIRVQVQRNELDSARVTVARAARSEVPRATLKVHEALVEAASGNLARARAALAEVPPAALAADPALARIAEAARLMMGAGR